MNTRPSSEHGHERDGVDDDRRGDRRSFGAPKNVVTPKR